MNAHRIKTMLLHSWYHFTHTMETWVDVFWNSSVQMIVFVLIAEAIQGESALGGEALVVGMIYWNVIWVGQYSTVFGALWEIWSRSLSSLFITPLTLNEFLAAQMLAGALKAFAAMTVASLIGYVFYGFSLLSLGPMAMVYFLELLVFSWGAGMCVLALIFRFGTDVQSLSWALIFLVQPFGAVFYPLGVLPPVIQSISRFVPTTYVFEALRAQLSGRGVIWEYHMLAALTIFLFTILGYIFVHREHERAKSTGAFARMEG